MIKVGKGKEIVVDANGHGTLHEYRKPLRFSDGFK
jgi:hypothetical protein